MLNDDWTYIGTEIYKSKKQTGIASILSGTYFDVLGRMSEKMFGNRFYFLKNKSIRNEWESSSGFEVYKKIIIDEQGNEIEIFIKKDKINNIRKDSIYYHDKYWSVIEFDNVANETRSKNSLGAKSLSRYENGKYLKEYYVIDKNGDTSISEKYEWLNGWLIQMTVNGVTRNYYYGNKRHDTVRVVPTDSGFNYHSGYDGTAGKMPELGDEVYDIFIIKPYGHVYFGDYEESESLNVLGKVVSGLCVSEKFGMPRAQCVRFERSDIPKNADKNFPFPSDTGFVSYGRSDLKLSLNFKCECNALGKYQANFEGKTINELLEIKLSVWRYRNYYKSDWHEFCWEQADLQYTYEHETQHIKNLRNLAITLDHILKKESFNTKKECEVNGKDEKEKLTEIWEIWYDEEQRHGNLTSPKSSEKRYGYLCN